VIDTHTHVTSCADDPAEVLARARAAGVSRVITIGSSSHEMSEAAALADGHPDVFTTAGLHPHHAADWSEAIADEIRQRAAHPRCVAIGETGLDWFRARAPREAQIAAFRAQLAIARELDLPVVIHCRDAADDCFAHLTAEAPPTVVLHCFAATERLDEAIEHGWYCSFAGNVTYGSAVDLQDAARRVPTELILLETDAPYLAPVPHRGRPNEPAYVMDTLAYVAGLRGVEPAQLADQVEANARRAFGLP
jgi:TatD DNase family protein